MRAILIKLGQRFFDERNTRYLTVDGQGCDPHCWRCIVEELGDSGDLELTGTELFMDNELRHMQLVE